MRDNLKRLNMNLTRRCWSPVLLFCVLCVATSAHASIIGVSLVPSPLTGSPGDTLTFQGTLFNSSGAAIWINEVSINLAGFDPSNVDPTDFILSATGLLLAGSSVGPVDFFAVTIPEPFGAGHYLGSVTVQGGATASDDAVLGTANFQVNVSTSGATVPEPSSLILTVVVIMGIAIKRCYR